MAFDCPGCMETIANGSTSHSCGWTKEGKPGIRKYTPTRETCPRCGKSGWARNYNDDGPDKLTPVWVAAHGSDRLHGWYHANCRPVTDVNQRRALQMIRDAKAGADGDWATAIRASIGPMDKPERREVLAYLRRTIEKIGELPYDKGRRG